MTVISKNNQELLDWDYLYEILDYDEDTGIFRWKRYRCWNADIGSIAGNVRKDGYIQIKINKILYLAHRLAWFYAHAIWPGEFIDHIDGIKDNNALNNLREATKAENGQNRKVQSNNKSGSKIPGVYFHNTSRKYYVQLVIGVKQKQFGPYETLEEAETECIRLRRIHYPFNTL